MNLQFSSVISDTPLRFLQDEVTYTAEPRPSKNRSWIGLGGGLSAQSNVSTEVTSVLEDIGTPEVPLYIATSQWTHVAPSFMGHRNICKSQKIIMTL
jgi:hypothetical protein